MCLLDMILQKVFILNKWLHVRLFQYQTILWWPYCRPDLLSWTVSVEDGFCMGFHGHENKLKLSPKKVLYQIGRICTLQLSFFFFLNNSVTCWKSSVKPWKIIKEILRLEYKFFVQSFYFCNICNTSCSNLSKMSLNGPNPPFCLIVGRNQRTWRQHVETNCVSLESGDISQNCIRFTLLKFCDYALH